MRDAILIEDLELSAQIGVPEEERVTPQRLTVTLVLEPSAGFAGLNDDIARAVNYHHAARAVQEEARRLPRRLIETLGEEIAALLLERFAVRAVELTLRKYILPDTSAVAVRLRRERS